MLLHGNVEVIAVGGSVGKTTTKDMTASVLSQQFATVKSKANFDPIFNLPQTVLTIRHHQKFVAEMGIDGPGQMAKYLTLVKPEMAIMTELSLEHTDKDHLQSLEMAVEEEWKLLAALPADGWAIVNGDNELIRQRLPSLNCNALTYGFEAHNNVRIASVEQSMKQGKAWLTITLSGEISGEFSTPILGRHNALSMAAAVCVGWKNDIAQDKIQAGLQEFSAPPHRLEIKPSEWGILIDDTYNSSPKAAIAAIDTLAEVGTKQSALVLGDMLELGDYAQQAHAEVGQYAAARGLENFVAIGQYAEDIKSGYRNGGGSGEVQVVSNRAQIIDWINDRRPNIVLFKASRGVKLNEVVAELVVDKPQS
jgi:UDP-N-acetylmuramoyl-tripeptide--D-alanyl-D-alanine ligase